MPPKRNRSVEEQELQKEQRKLKMRERRNDPEYRIGARESNQSGDVVTLRSQQIGNEVAIASGSQRSDSEIQEERRIRNRMCQSKRRSNPDYRQLEHLQAIHLLIEIAVATPSIVRKSSIVIQ